MAEKKIIWKQKTGDTTFDTLFPQTTADQVIYNGSSVQEALANIGTDLDKKFVTLDTAQTITGVKTFDDHLYVSDGEKHAEYSNAGITVRDDAEQTKFTYKFPTKDGTFALAEEIPSIDNVVTLDTEQTIIGGKTFSNTVFFTKTRGLSGYTTVADIVCSSIFAREGSNKYGILVGTTGNGLWGSKYSAEEHSFARTFTETPWATIGRNGIIDKITEPSLIGYAGRVYSPNNPPPIVTDAQINSLFNE